MITLEKITWDNFDDIICLKVKAEQDSFIADNVYSLAQSYVALLNDENPPISLAILNDGKVIGYTLISYNKPEENIYEYAPYYNISRFMIGSEFQGKGFGKAAFKVILDYLCTKPQGEADAVYLSYSPGNTVARLFYEKFGFIETGKLCGDEIDAKLTFQERIIN